MPITLLKEKDCARNFQITILWIAYSNKQERGACYVKGALMCTRSIGDFYLKNKEFAYILFNRGQSFNGPYIEVTPEIMKLDITPEYKFLVMGSDGFWDEITQMEVAEIISSTNDKQLLVGALMGSVLGKIAKRNRISVNELHEYPIGKYRRRMHDDISIVIISL